MFVFTLCPILKPIFSLECHLLSDISTVNGTFQEPMQIDAGKHNFIFGFVGDKFKLKWKCPNFSFIFYKRFQML